MKFPAITSISLAWVSLASMTLAAQAGDIKNRPTQADLASRVAARGKPLEGQRAVKVLAPESVGKKQGKGEVGGLLQRSTILSQGGYWTLVPKGSVLHVPPAYLSRVISSPVDAGKLLPWNEFLARNKGWILPQPVAITDARGESSLSEAVLETHRKVGRVVVAVLHNGPISVKAPLPQEENNATNSDPQPPQKK